MALTNCPNCGHPISAKAPECPNCHRSFSIKSILEGKWGKYFLFYCILLFLSFVLGAILFIEMNSSTMENLTENTQIKIVITTGSLLYLIYMVGVVGINYILGLTCKSKRRRLISLILCIMFFVLCLFYMISLFSLSNNYGFSIFLIVSAIIMMMTAFLLLTTEIERPIKYPVIALALGYFPILSPLLIVAVIWLLYYAVKYVYRR